MIRGVDHGVDLIADFTDGSTPPMGALSQFKSAYENAPPNAGMVVVVSRNFIIRSLVSMFGALYHAWGYKIMVADTVEEARHKIAQMRSRSG